MLLKFIIPILFSFFWFSLDAQDKAGFPKYKEVVEALAEKGEFFITFDFYKKVAIEKRKDGYWVGIATWVNIDSGHVIGNKKQFWTEKNGYSSLKFSGDKENSSPISNNDIIIPYKKHAVEEMFDMHPFYGYKGWFHDVIELYESKKGNLSAKEHYSLARAYSTKASGLLKRTFNYLSSYTGHFELSKERNSLRGKNLSDYKKVRNKAINSLYSAYQSNPNLETIVGSIYTKYCNEIGTKYVDLSIYSTKKEAFSVFDGKKLYTQTTLDFSRNYLRSCPPNSILFTYGDNNTYSLLYLQATEKLRLDVLIVVGSLLQTSEYINHLRDSNFYDNTFPCTVDAELYYNQKNNYVLIKDEGGPALGIEDLVKILETSKYTDENINAPPLTLPSNKIRINISSKKETTLHCPGTFLAKDHLLNILMLNANKGKRPVCYTYYRNNPLIDLIGVKSYLHQVGMVSQLFFEEKSNEIEVPKLSTIYPILNTQRSYEIIAKELKWKSFNNIETDDVPNYYQYTNTVINLAKSLINEKEQEKALEIIDGVLEIFPPSSAPLEARQLIEFFELLYLELEQEEKSTKLIQNYLKRFLLMDGITQYDSYSIRLVEEHLNKRSIKAFEKSFQKIYQKPTIFE